MSSNRRHHVRHVSTNQLLTAASRKSIPRRGGGPPWSAPSKSSTGRPSIDPELMIRMLPVGYCLGIRSERRLCEEGHLNLAYRWFCRL
ncbi:transposase, partial [Cereibacter sphaeroides]